MEDEDSAEELEDTDDYESPSPDAESVEEEVYLDLPSLPLVSFTAIIIFSPRKGPGESGTETNDSCVQRRLPYPKQQYR